MGVSDWWRGRNVLVTGAYGFIGTHLMRWLEKGGAQVLPVSSNVGKTHRGGTLDVRLLASIFKRERPSVCIHLGGVSTVEEGIQAPYRTVLTNVLGILNLLDAVRTYGTSRVVIVSTSQVYQASSRPLTERSPLMAARPYETSKVCIDMLSQSFAKTYGLPIVIGRFVNIYGPGDTHLSRIIPKLISEIMHVGSVTLWGNGMVVREYLYIDDAIRAIDLLCRVPEPTIRRYGVFNFGTGKAVSAHVIAKNIASLMNVPAQVHMSGLSGRTETTRTVVSSGRARRVLEWQPTITLTDGLRRTVAWYCSQNIHRSLPHNAPAPNRAVDKS